MRKLLCKLGIHTWRPFFDIEYSRNGEMYFCEYCEAER